MERRFNFIKKKIDSLPLPETKQMYYWDTQVRGLCLSVARGGSKSFVLRRKIAGRSERLWLGSYPDLSIERARKLAYEKNAEIADGVNPADLKRQRKAEPTLEDLFAEYLERHAEKQRKTADDMRKNFDRYLGHWRNRKASSISNKDVEQLHGKLSIDKGIYTANRTLQLLRAVFNKAIVWHLFDKENPAKGISLFQERSRERFLTKEEATKLLRALELESNDDLRDFIKLSFFTGVRKANLMSIRWDWIDWESATLTIPDTKNNTKQVVSLGGLEVTLLRNRLERLEKESEDDGTKLSEYVFPGAGRDGHLKDLKRSWTTFRRKVGLEDVTIHDLRRSLGATMANANLNISLVKSALHHKDMKTTLSVYARTHQEAVRDARERALKPILMEAGLIEKKVRKRI